MNTSMICAMVQSALPGYSFCNPVTS